LSGSHSKLATIGFFYHKCGYLTISIYGLRFWAPRLHALNRITPKRSRMDRAGGLPARPRSVRRTTLNIASGSRR